MATVKLRPTFLLETDLSAPDAMHCIQDSVTRSMEDYQGQFTSHHAMISVAESKRHFWSPWLHLEIRELGPNRHVFGRFSPHPSIWTGFMFSYLSVGVLLFFTIIFGVSQQLSGEIPFAFGLIPILLLIAAALWFASKIGQQLAHAEMETLRAKIENCING